MNNNMYYPTSNNSFGMVATVKNYISAPSLKDAIDMCRQPNSENIVFHESLPEFYNIRVDAGGNKTWATFPFTVAETVQNNAPVTRDEFNQLSAKIEALLGKISEGAEVTNNG